MYFKFIQPFSPRLTPLCHLAQIERGYCSLLNAYTIGKLRQDHRKIFHISNNSISITARTLRRKDAGGTDHAGNRTNHVVAEVYAMGTHIPNFT